MHETSMKRTKYLIISAKKNFVSRKAAARTWSLTKNMNFATFSEFERFFFSRQLVKRILLLNPSVKGTTILKKLDT